MATTLASQSPDARPLVSACDCQGVCVNAIVGSCYSSCVDQCDGDTVALGVCKGTCRDQRCERLTKACTDDGTGNSPYALCCKQCNNCNSDLDNRFACEQLVTTTTTTLATTTTTTTTSSTTTTHL